MNYRREIDGLRAVAVVPVILFHTGLHLFSGGFVGVDVFFVISGYLITTIIIQERAVGTFTMVSFYERRARRILPELYVVVLICIPVAWFLFLPHEMRRFAQSLVGIPSFSTNILFWLTGGYFESSTELKPLLHTWSLSVEEQYYLLFPSLLLLGLRFNKRWMLTILGLVFGLSLWLAQAMVITQPEFTFYMLPPKLWEFIAGVFVAFYLEKRRLSKRRRSRSRLLKESAGLLGLALIGFAIFTFDKDTPYPSVYTLVPVVGAGLVIVYTSKRTSVGKLLGSEPLVGIGVVSYGAYLWHQPLLAFSRHVTRLGTPDVTVLVSLGIASFVLAYISRRFIEIPFRDKRRVSRKQLVVFVGILSVLFLALGLVGHVRQGDLGQLNRQQREFLDYFETQSSGLTYIERTKLDEKTRTDCNFLDLEKHKHGVGPLILKPKIPQSCFQLSSARDKAVLIWGDSHAQHLRPGLEKYLPKDWDLLQIASTGCTPKLNAEPNEGDYCEYSNWFTMTKIREIKPLVVIVAQRAGQNLSTMLKIADALNTAGVQQVIFLGPAPNWPLDLSSVIASNFLRHVPRYTHVGVDRTVIELDHFLKNNFPISTHAKYVSLIDFFCNESGCATYFGDDVKTGITTFDYGHLTSIASEAFSKSVLVKEIVGTVPTD